jgi:hypothetical protein
MADFGKNDTIVSFGADDAVVPTADPVKANEILNDGLLYNASPEESEAITGVLSPQDMEFNTAKDKVRYEYATGTCGS